MAKINYDLILNMWKINDEAERWSIKSLFIQRSLKSPTVRDFENFLLKRFGTRPKTF